MVNLLLCCTGSVACIKIPQLVEKLISTLSLTQDQIKIATTNCATHFFDIDFWPSVFQDKDEWNGWSKMGDQVMHIELGKWADIIIFAPLDANTLGKLAHGVCDNLVTCIARAWDLEKLFLFCPAMNTRMWLHPVTRSNVDVLKSWGSVEIPPVTKTLACGETGVGAMANVDDIVLFVKKSLGL